MTERIIVLLDMDCFYVQVEERENPQIKGVPAAVVQYNSWKGGGIIAVNYEARAAGVKRGMRGDEAKEKCPSIHLVQVPVQRGKADLTRYRNAGKEVVSVLCQFSDCVERASVDEAYIDFTKTIEEKHLNSRERIVPTEDLPSTWVVGYDEAADGVPSQTTRHDGLSCWLSDTFQSSTKDEQSNIQRLSLAAEICEEMRRKVYEETGFKCSAGISHNKMLAKLACGLHKPDQQTILPLKSVPQLWSHLALGKVRNLGGKLGDSIHTDLHCETMADVAKLSLEKLRSKYDEKTATWLFSLGRGIDSEAVTPRQLPKSIGCGKNFNGKEILNTKSKVSTWMKSLADELSERLIEDQSSNERIAKTFTLHLKTDCEEKPITTRSCPLPSYKSEVITKVALGLIANANTASSKEEKWDPPIRNISLSASKFENLCVEGMTKINNIFKKLGPSTPQSTTQSGIGSPNHSKNCGSGMELPDDQPKQNVGTNPQKSFFLQFLSQSSSEKIKRKFFSEFKNTENDNDICHEINGDCDPCFDDHEATKGLDHYADLASKGLDHHADLATKVLDHHADVASNGIDHHADLATKGLDHHADLATKDLDHHADLASNGLDHHADLASNGIDHHTDLASKGLDHHADLATKGIDHHADLASNGIDHHADLASNGIDHHADLASNNNESIDDELSDSDDAYNNSTDIDELNDESETVEVIDISSEAPSPVLKPKRSKSPVIEVITQVQNVASCSNLNHISDEAASDCVSVRDIFPNLDDVDWSVVDLLPVPLRKRVHDEVQRHKRLSGADVDTVPPKKSRSSDVLGNKEDKEVSIPPKKSRSSDILGNEETVQTSEDRYHSYSSLDSPKLNPYSPLDSSQSFEKFTFCRECHRKILTVNFTEHSDYHFATELRKQQIMEARTSQASMGSTAKKKENSKNSPVKTASRKKNRKSGIENCMPKIEDYFKKK